MDAALEKANVALAPVIDILTQNTILTEQQAKLTLAAVGSSVSAYALWKLLLSGQNYNLPPGPRPLPLIGNLHNMGKNPRGYLVFDELKKKYGDIVMFYLGPVRVYLLNNADASRDAFLRDGVTFADRPNFASLDVLSNGRKDIIGAEYGPRLQLQRKVALAALRQYASGKSLEHHIGFGMEAIVKDIDANKGSFIPVELGYLFAYNIIASMCFGRKFELDDPFLQNMMEIQRGVERSFGGPEAFFFLLPFMKHFPSTIMKQVRVMSKLIHEFLGNVLTEHINSYDPEKLTDFTYYMIHSWKEAEKDPNEKSKMKLLTHEHFTFILMDMFLAGTETTRQTLAWVTLYLAAFPEVQKKAQDEIDNAIGDDPVGVDAREKLPYVDAILHEVMRIMPVVPGGLPRQAMKDTKIHGYDVPKGTMVMLNIWSIHHDERVWKEPFAFLPERWLDENGQYIFQQHGFVPFSIGRRSCIGESFAKLELHMITTMILQKYNLKPEPGKRINLETMEMGAVRAPDQRIVAELRRK